MRRLAAILIVLGLITGLLLPLAAWGAETVLPSPPPGFYVLDQAGLLDSQDEAAILALSGELEDKTGAQVVVVTVTDLGELTVEDYALELFRSWGIGSAETDNGVLLLLKMGEPSSREARIEVGYGLEGVINDAKAGRIMDLFLIPAFEQGDFAGGIMDSYRAILGEVAFEYQVELSSGEINPLPAETQEAPPMSPLAKFFLGLVVVLLIIIDWRFFNGTFTWLILSSLGRGGGGSGGRRGGGGSSGGGGASRRF